MPFGLQRHLEIARALALEPKIILLDEPAGGLNPGETRVWHGLIHKIRDTNVTVVLIEHDMSLIMNISDRIIVLQLRAEDRRRDTERNQSNEAVIEAYLGNPPLMGLGDRAIRHGMRLMLEINKLTSFTERSTSLKICPCEWKRASV